MKSSNPINILPLTVLFLSISRGLIALLMGGMSTQLVYYGVTIFGVAVSLLGITRKKMQIVGGKKLYQILVVNLLVYIYWIVTDLLLGGGAESILYFLRMALIPFVIYMFLNVDEKLLMRLLFVVSVLVAASCILDFILLNTNIVANGRDWYFWYASAFRQGGMPLGSHIAHVYRATGITGNMHDSGNLMAILVVFWFGIIMTRRGLRYVIISMPIFIVALLMTFSVSNIFAAFAGVVAIIIYQMRFIKLRNISVIISVLIVGGAIYLLAEYFFNFNWSLITGWTLKLRAVQWKAITTIGASDFWTDFFMFFAGHGFTAKISNIPFITEFAVLRMAYNSGLFTFIISLLLILYPVLCFFKSSRLTRKMMLPAVTAVGVGVLSLWHYGSVFRSTNIFLFYTMFAIAIQNKVRNHLLKQ